MKADCEESKDRVFEGEQLGQRQGQIMARQKAQVFIAVSREHIPDWDEEQTIQERSNTFSQLLLEDVQNVTDLGYWPQGVLLLLSQHLCLQGLTNRVVKLKRNVIYYSSVFYLNGPVGISLWSSGLWVLADT